MKIDREDGIPHFDGAPTGRVGARPHPLREDELVIDPDSSISAGGAVDFPGCDSNTIVNSKGRNISRI